MRLSTDRILTTHVGSMPRPQKLVDALLKKDHGETYDPVAYDKTIHDAVTAVVARQVEAGVDDHPVFLLHRVRQGPDVLLVRRIVLVGLEGGDQAGRGGV
ncbi:MAG: 5-methyltetrahydropteroyltriglutamate/homocysteine S-methyltransferase, partial [Caulobacteraceae bacterium]|nr:5-methyltetrahydropteroyltriglutamate/homocysteine S-methyltransferase [Caulobacteraceae bacterium]